MAIVIELVGGPHDGVLHEVVGQLLPYALGLKHEGEPHWYRVDPVSGKGEYVGKEPPK